MKFLGIDLGWRSGASGLCCLSWELDPQSPQGASLKILDVDLRLSLADILAWVDAIAPQPEPALIAVDAPTLIPNQTGMRLPDQLTHRYFHRYHAGCYPANLNRPFAERTVAFGLSLESRGFNHAAEIEPQKRDRYQIEVFPHPAIVHLFNLERILKYKKGKLADRSLELLKLQQFILNILPTLEPSLNVKDANFAHLLAANHSPKILSGKAFKALEDQLDALICAYVGAHWWYWGLQRNLVLGDRATGYIVIPAKQMAGETNLVRLSNLTYSAHNTKPG